MTHRARAARARNTLFTDFIQHPVAHLTPRTPADLGISINLLLAAALRVVPMRRHAFTELAKGKAQRVRDLCLIF
jgi:hypothetical protein